MATARTVAQDDADKMKVDWQDSIELPEGFQKFRAPMLEMPSELSTMWDGHLGRINAAKDRIELASTDVWPIHSALYRAEPAARAFQKEEIYKMYKHGVIEPAHTEWAAPIVFAPKKYVMFRSFVGYRKLNAVSVGDACPISRMHECIGSLGDAKLFPTLDANCGYWQIEIE